MQWMILILACLMPSVQSQPETTEAPETLTWQDPTAIEDVDLLIASLNDTAEIKRLVANSNQARYQHAKQFNISNMHELVWDDQLVAEASVLTTLCRNTPFAGANYRQYLRDESELRIQNLNWVASRSMDDYLGGTSEYKDGVVVDGDYLGSYERFVPLQTRMGCAVTACRQLICNYGPRNDWKRKEWKRGAVGEDCPQSKTESHWLCIPHPEPPANPETAPMNQSAPLSSMVTWIFSIIALLLM